MTSILNYSEDELEALQRNKDKKWLSSLLSPSSLSSLTPPDKDALSGQVLLHFSACLQTNLLRIYYLTLIVSSCLHNNLFILMNFAGNKTIACPRLDNISLYSTVYLQHLQYTCLLGLGPGICLDNLHLAITPLIVALLATCDIVILITYICKCYVNVPILQF